MLKENLTLIALPENSPGADCKPSKCKELIFKYLPALEGS